MISPQTNNLSTVHIVATLDFLQLVHMFLCLRNFAYSYPKMYCTPLEFVVLKGLMSLTVFCLQIPHLPEQ
jgi:hypothetical protein